MERLAGCVSTYTKDVKAFLHRLQHKRLKHKPATVVEVMLLEYDQRERQIKALEGIEDALRAGVSYFPSFPSVQLPI